MTRFEFALYLDHRHFDEIGGCPLEGRIQRGALGESSHIELRRRDFRNWAATAKKGAGKAAATDLLEATVEIFFYAVISLEIGGNEFRGFFLIDLQILRQAKRRQAVDNSEVDHFRRTAMLGGLRHRADAEDLLRGARVNVLSRAESLDEHGIFRKMRKDSKLDLRIIGREQSPAGFGHKGGTNLPA